MGLRKAKYKASKKHVSWHPSAKAISRPCIKKRINKRKTEITFIDLKKRKNTMIHYLTAHSRTTNHNLLITMRGESGHKLFQLLIDLPYRMIKRIYDGNYKYNVSNHSNYYVSFYCKLGSILWDDGETRSAKVRGGFNLEWLNGWNHVCVIHNK